MNEFRGIEVWLSMVSGVHEDAHGAISRDVQAQAGAKTVDPVAGKTVAEILGEIVWLMTQDPVGREMKVADIEALVMPAILARRFHIKYAQVPDMRRPGATTLQPVEVSLISVNPRGGDDVEQSLVFSLPMAATR